MTKQSTTQTQTQWSTTNILSMFFINISLHLITYNIYKQRVRIVTPRWRSVRVHMSTRPVSVMANINKEGIACENRRRMPEWYLSIALAWNSVYKLASTLEKTYSLILLFNLLFLSTRTTLFNGIVISTNILRTRFLL